MKIVFERSENPLNGIFSNSEEDCLSLSLNFMGKPLIVYDIEKLASTYETVEQVFIPEDLSDVMKVVEEAFPSIHVDEYKEGNGRSIEEEGYQRISLNSIVLPITDKSSIARQIVRPWDILTVMNHLLESDVKTSWISPDATLSSKSEVQGPCVIESGAYLDDFCKIKGPAYIGKNVKVGTGSLVRNSMIGNDCTIGFNCEIGRSYLTSNDTIPHLDVILDSVIGQNTWMGGYVAITNVLLNSRSVKYKIGDSLIDTGLQHFGAVIGHDSTIGAGVIILPGRYIPAGSVIQPGIVFSSMGEIRHREYIWMEGETQIEKKRIDLATQLNA